MNAPLPPFARLIPAALLALLFAAVGANAATPSVEMVGAAQAETKLPLPADSGTLRVYSETYKVAAARGGSAVEFPHSGFVLLSVDGRILSHVANNDGTQKESPVPVVLAAGRYAVRARSAAYGEVVIPIEISAGKATLVYLTSAGMPAGIASKADSLVRLPNGLVIGVRAPSMARRPAGGT